jgi:transposase
LEAVRLVKGGHVAAVTAKILGILKQTLENWLRLANKGQLKGAGVKPVSPEQMELARLRAENARLRMERDILGKATAKPEPNLRPHRTRAALTDMCLQRATYPFCLAACLSRPQLLAGQPHLLAQQQQAQNPQLPLAPA